MGIIKRKKIVNPDARVNLFSAVIASGFGAGYAPAASGTVGSLIALLVLFVPFLRTYPTMAVLIILGFIAGIYTSKDMMKKYGDDPSVVVIDEMVGMWITLFIILHPLGVIGGWFQLLAVGIAFLAFRFFDIVKVPPAGYFDRQKTAFGVMMDDVIAGIYAGIVSLIILNIIILFILVEGMS